MSKSEKEKAKKLARWALGGAIGFIGIGIYTAWPPLAFIWFGGWLFVLSMIAQQIGDREDG